jgi:hypothetical protein
MAFQCFIMSADRKSLLRTCQTTIKMISARFILNECLPIHSSVIANLMREYLTFEGE